MCAKPRVVVRDNFLSPTECAYLRTHASLQVEFQELMGQYAGLVQYNASCVGRGARCSDYMLAKIAARKYEAQQM